METYEASKTKLMDEKSYYKKTCLFCGSIIYGKVIHISQFCGKKATKAYKDSEGICKRCYLLTQFPYCYQMVSISVWRGKLGPDYGADPADMWKLCHVCGKKGKCDEAGDRSSLFSGPSSKRLKDASVPELKNWVLSLIDTYGLVRRYDEHQWRDWIAMLARKEETLT